MCVIPVPCRVLGFSYFLNMLTGMILLSELSRRRIRSINKLIRVGRSECVVVIRVDKDKGTDNLFTNLFKYYCYLSSKYAL